MGRPGLLLAALAALVAWAYRPYLGGTLVGAGDAYHYALQVGDYVTQVRAGHFPVFIGQTEYAYNGNIHTLRTAPYFLHFAGLVDLLTGRRLGFAALLDLTLVLHALGGALAAYFAGRALGAGDLIAAGLAALYVVSPAILGPLQTEDMVATSMALPWLPLLLWAVVAVAERNDPWPGALAGAWLLAVIWWAHPAIGAWAGALWALGWAFRLARAPQAGVSWLAFLTAAAGCALMSAYCFVSVRSLHLGYDLGDIGGQRRALLDRLRDLWPGYLVPPASGSNANLQPGYGLWLAALAGMGAWGRRRWAAGLLAAAVILILLLLGAIPPVAAWLWAAVPAPVLAATNIWPVQRLGPLLAAVLWALAAVGLSRIGAASAGRRRLFGAGLLAAIAWSCVAAAPLRQHARESAATPEATAQQLDPRNLELTRASYAMFGRFPPYFSNGRVSAPWDIRLLEPGNPGTVLTDNASAVVAGLRASGPPPVLQALAPLAAVAAEPGQGYVLEFSFAHPEAAGDIEIFGRGLARVYSLPSSGMGKAFGAAPGNSPYVGYMPAEHDNQAIIVKASVPGAAMRAYPFDPETLPLRIDSLIPLRARVRADRPALLETPRAFVPGYRATVDGRPAPVSASPSGLAMLAVPAGEHRVEVRYAVPAAVTAAYALSLSALALWGAGLGLLLRRRSESTRLERGRALGMAPFPPPQ
ncbi:MAG TPA: hypothetical protein VHV47_12895 [Opitutaceae bacterium]|nr:hypothetical protein [Opitutaceae bacterium]